jgi:hypothetical protein
MSALDVATSYAHRGWAVIPVPDRSKDPGIPGWPKLRLKEPDLAQYFNGHRQNIGVLTGEPSNWLVDVDLDHPRCIELADQFLPPTPAVFGRRSKPRSHRLYYLTGPASTRIIRSKSAGTLVELRSTGLQTVVAPGTHESGEAIEWEEPDAEPATVDPEQLLAAVQALGDAVKVELGEKAAPRKAKPPRADGDQGQVTAAKSTARCPQRVKACVAAMQRMHMTDHKDGSSRLFAACCRAVEHNLSDSDAITAIREYATKQPFPNTWSEQDILKRLGDAEQATQRGLIGLPEASDGRARVVIDADEHRVVNETVEALKPDDAIFHRGGALVRVIVDAPPSELVRRQAGSPTIALLPPAALRERMTKFIEFTQFVRRGQSTVEVPAHPTQWLVGAVDARGQWPGLRPLSGISDVPVLRPDGSLWQTSGYDRHTRVLYQPTGEFPTIDDHVGIDDADAAVDQLLEVVCDFKFESDDHRAAWIAGLLTPVARFAFEGPTPLFLIDANIRGAGKGLLAQTIGQIVLGRELPVSSYAHDPEEMRKKITAIALAGDRMVHLDNLEGNFGNDALDRALTTTRWKDRILGKSQEVDLPLLPVWYGTGNNVAVAADTTRRIIHIRLDVLDEKPEERTGFRHPQLLNWISANRGRLLCSAITVLRAYFNAGMPPQGLTPFGSFEGWSGLVREAVVWTGQPDPCRTRAKLAERSDTTADALGQLISAWRQIDPAEAGIVVSDLLARLYPREFQPRDDASIAMRAALENLVCCPAGKAPGPRQVAAKLRFYRRRVVSGTYIDSNPDEYHRNGAVWRLHRA